MAIEFATTPTKALKAANENAATNLATGKKSILRDEGDTLGYYYSGSNDSVFTNSVKDIFGNNANASIEQFDEHSLASLGLTYNKDDAESIYKYSQDIGNALDYMESKYTKAQLAGSEFYNSLLKEQQAVTEQLPEIESQLDRI